MKTLQEKLDESCDIKFVMARDIKNCNKDNAIPDQVLRDILSVYEFGELSQLGDLPDLICQRDGSFWTTWSRVIEIRNSIRKD